MPILGVFASSRPVITGAFESIATLTPTTGYRASFTSIPSTYKHLQLRIMFISSEASMSDMVLQFNSDTGANYARHRLTGNGSTVGATGNAPDSLIAIISNTVSSPGATTPRVALVDILDYASTTKNKTVRAVGAFDSNSANSVIGLFSGLWINTAAISRIDVDTFNLYAAGTTISLYGIKGAA